MNQITYLQKIKQGDNSTLQSLYSENRDVFFGWARRQSNLDEDQLADVFQNAVIILYKNVRDGKIVQLDTTVKTYLFGIAKNLMKQTYSTQSKVVALNPSDDINLERLDMDMEEKENITHQRSVLLEALETLGDPCSRILDLFYFRRYSIDAIVHEMGYNHIDVVRTQKGRCIKKLRKLFETSYGQAL